MTNDEKLKRLADVEGMDEMEMLEEATYDSVAKGICCNPAEPDCEYTTEVEPDQDMGWCEFCGTPTVKSCLILADII